MTYHQRGRTCICVLYLLFLPAFRFCVFVLLLQVLPVLSLIVYAHVLSCFICILLRGGTWNSALRVETTLLLASVYVFIYIYIYIYIYIITYIYIYTHTCSMDMPNVYMHIYMPASVKKHSYGK